MNGAKFTLDPLTVKTVTNTTNGAEVRLAGGTVIATAYPIGNWVTVSSSGSITFEPAPQTAEEIIDRFARELAEKRR